MDYRKEIKKIFGNSSCRLPGDLGKRMRSNEELTKFIDPERVCAWDDFMLGYLALEYMGFTIKMYKESQLELPVSRLDENVKAIYSKDGRMLYTKF